MKLLPKFFLIILTFPIGFKPVFGQLTTTATSDISLTKERPSSFFDEKRHALKISLQSIILDKGEYISITYEYLKSRRNSYLFTLGIKGSNHNTSSYLDSSIGDVVTVAEIPNGFFLKFSSRYYSSKRGFHFFKIKPSNFQGYYIDPEFVFGFYNSNVISRILILPTPPVTTVSTSRPILVRKKVWYVGLTTNFGMQKTFKRMLIDVHLGLGLGYDNLKKESFPFSYEFNHRGLYKRNGNISFAFQFDAKIGGIF